MYKDSRPAGSLLFPLIVALASLSLSPVFVQAQTDSAEAASATALQDGEASTEQQVAGLLAQADEQRAAGKVPEAIEIVQQAIVLQESTGAASMALANSLRTLANLYLQQEENHKEVTQRQRVLEIFQETYGDKHWGSVGAARELDDAQKRSALTESQQKSRQESEKEFLESYNSDNLPLAIERARKRAELDLLYLGGDSLSYERSLMLLAIVHQMSDETKEVERLYKQIIEIRVNGLGEEHPDTTAGMNDLASLYQDMDDYAKAEPLHKQSLKIRTKVLGDEHPFTAMSLNNLASLYHEMGDYAKSEPLYEQSLKIARKVLGEEHLATAGSIQLLGDCYFAQQEYAKAEPLLIRALEIRTKVLGDEHSDTAVSMNNLGTRYREMGDYAKAEPLLIRSLEIWTKVFGEEHQNTAVGLNALAMLHLEMGDYAKAEPLCAQSLKINRKVLGEKHPNTASNMNLLGIIYRKIGNYPKAEPLLIRSLEIRTKVFGEEHQETAGSLINLSNLYQSMADFVKAEPLLIRSLEIRTKVFGEKHPETVVCMNNLGLLYHEIGNYPKAESLLIRSLEIRRKVFGEEHRDTAHSLHHLAFFYQKMGDYAKAEPLYAEAMEITQHNLDITASVQSERQQLLMADQMSWLPATYLGTALKSVQNIAEAYHHALAWKGVVTVRQQSMRLIASRPDLAPLFDQLQNVASRLAQLTMSDKQIPPDLRTRQLSELSERKEEIEKQISSRSEEYRNSKIKVSLVGLQKSLPPGGVLVDYFFSINNNDAQPSTNQDTGSQDFEWRLVAFVLHGKHPVQLVDLCSATALEIAIESWRDDLASTTAPATELGKLIWDPLAAYVGDAELVLYSPVGRLGSIPLGVLPGEDEGSYLIEERKIVMVPQPQMLPALLEKEKDASQVPTILAVGSVDYDTATETQTSEDPVKLAGVGGGRRAVGWQGQDRFAPLPGTAGEISSVSTAYHKHFGEGQIKTLQRAQATETTVRALAPRFSYLHFATHGFFAPPQILSALNVSDKEPSLNRLGSTSESQVIGYHPGLLSGLALAGANNPPNEGDDGIWTAEEVATMDLSNVDLAVLSACETGLGKVAGGEGLLGLQRAFQVSGAKTSVASLWQVDDAATRSLMEEFYRNLWEKKLSKIDALREAQLSMMRTYDPKVGKLRGVGGIRKVEGKTSDRLPPFYWAAWILSGDWR